MAAPRGEFFSFDVDRAPAASAHSAQTQTGHAQTHAHTAHALKDKLPGKRERHVKGTFSRCRLLRRSCPARARRPSPAAAPLEKGRRPSDLGCSLAQLTGTFHRRFLSRTNTHTTTQHTAARPSPHARARRAPKSQRLSDSNKRKKRASLPLDALSLLRPLRGGAVGMELADLGSVLLPWVLGALVGWLVSFRGVDAERERRARAKPQKGPLLLPLFPREMPLAHPRPPRPQPPPDPRQQLPRPRTLSLGSPVAAGLLRRGTAAAYCIVFVG